MSLVIKDDRSKLDSLLKNVKNYKKSYTIVGFQRSDGIKEKKGNVLVVDVAIANEFGTSKIPARSFMRTYFDENKDKLAQLSAKLYDQVFFKNKDPKKALSWLGEYAKTGIIKKIDSIYTPPNAPATIKRKSPKSYKEYKQVSEQTMMHAMMLGGNVQHALIMSSMAVHMSGGAKPLIDTGQMRQSITHKEYIGFL